MGTNDDQPLSEFLSKLTALVERERDACPICGAQVTYLKQIGRSVHAQPCGHRLWQGKIPVKWRKTSAKRNS